jgi:alpha-L-fucosidase
MKAIVFACCLIFVHVNAQEHHQQYFPPTDSLVLQQLDKWQGFKFGLMMHWGTYAQLGVVESWSICPEDEDWCVRRGPFKNNYFAYVQAYEALQQTFNPIQFQPEKWAKAAKYAGMKYMVFTTKHHDGFCMFDTKETDYKITSPQTPFASNPNANITKVLFDAFREEGFSVGAYFSKPDWHCADYWDPTFPPVDRNPNYNLNKYPAKWNEYVDFTHKQILELMRDYGKVDLLWLDGGWVQPMTDTSPRWGYKPVHQDIYMDSLVQLARLLQPGLIVVDRAVEGPNQNYLTPEQQIPNAPLPYPWESCMTMANSWSYVPNDTYKSTKQLLSNLCMIVARGGNYLLNISPNALGEWDAIAYQRLNEIGDWMQINGQAIYETHPIFPYEQQTEFGKWVFTENDKNEVFACFIPTGLFETAQITLSLKDFKTKAFSSVQLLSGKRTQPDTEQILRKVNQLNFTLQNQELPIVWKLF